MHSVEEFYNKCKVLHEKAVHLHRERFKKFGEYDKDTCKFMVEDIQAMALLLARSEIDLDKNFAEK